MYIKIFICGIFIYFAQSVKNRYLETLVFSFMFNGNRLQLWNKNTKSKDILLHAFYNLLLGITLKIMVNPSLVVKVFNRILILK